MKILTNIEIQYQVMILARKIAKDQTINNRVNITLYGVPRGGIPVAYLLKGHLIDAIVCDKPEEADIIIDDIVDSGETKIRYLNKYDKPFYALYENTNEWLVFPWEQKDKETPLYDNILRIEQFLKDSNDLEKQNVINSITNILDATKK